MPWTSLRVRPATAADLPALVALGEELRDQLGSAAEVKRSRAAANGRPSLEQRYVDALADPDRHLVVAATDEGQVLAMALFTVGSSNALLDTPALHVTHAIVSAGNKRRGAGKALVAAAAAFAEERGLEQVVVSVHPGSRDANRFFARLGFAPVAVRRVAPTAVVRRRLHTADVPAEHVVRRRPRRLPRLPASAPVLPLGPADPDL